MAENYLLWEQFFNTHPARNHYGCLVLLHSCYENVEQWQQSFPYKLKKHFTCHILLAHSINYSLAYNWQLSKT